MKRLKKIRWWLFIWLIRPWWKYIAAWLFGACPGKYQKLYTMTDTPISWKHRFMYPTLCYSMEFDGLCVDWYDEEYYI